MGKAKLTSKQKEVVRLLQKGGAYISISRFSDNMRVHSNGFDSPIRQNTIDALIDRDLISYNSETPTSNIYTLTPLGKSIEL